MGLKSRICLTLGWDEYPGDVGDRYKSFKTHNFEDLLHLSGVEKRIYASLMAECSIAKKWDPKIRYSSERQIGEDVKLMIEATETLLREL